MKYRLYWWFKHVDPKRLGGPWWCQDFYSEEDRQEYRTVISPFCHKIMECEVELGISIGYPNNICPPEGAREIL
jgi:hypothetical protein